MSSKSTSGKEGLFQRRSLMKVGPIFALVGVLVLASCGESVDKVLSLFQGAIDTLDRNSVECQGTLRKLEGDLISEGQMTLANEVQSLANRSIATAGNELRCDTDFIGRRMRQGLSRILLAFQNKPLPPLEPGFCQVDP